MPSLQALLDPLAELHSCRNLLGEGSSYQQQLDAIRRLGSVNDRQVYSLLFPVLSASDEDLAAQAILALAHIRDSRALFPLINYFHSHARPLPQQRILQYLHYTRDPRAEDFLEHYLSQENPPFREIARNALERCRNYTGFLYRYAGSDEEHRQALQTTGQFPVRGQELNRIEDILQEGPGKVGTILRPQTYILDEEGRMYIGGHLQEHVQVARGREVYAAGEVIFSKLEKEWGVDMINHRSCGYFPARSCFYWVERFFQQSDIQFKKTSFDDKFPREGYNDGEFLSLFPFALSKP